MPLTRVEFDQALVGLRHELLDMGALDDSMVERGLRALADQDVPLAEEVIAGDDAIDALDLHIETECLRLIALEQPVARDLRLIGTAMKVITDLERIGDHAVDIAKVARKLAREPIYKPLIDIPRMGTCVRGMLQDALRAFVEHDVVLVGRVIDADDEVDALYHELREELHSVMRQQPDLVVQASYLLFVAHYLERMADHVVNIAERVHYVETGELTQLAKSHKAGS